MTEPFAQLTEEEREAAPEVAAPTDEWSPILPVPDDAPDPDFTHYKRGAHSGVWPYANAEGRLLGYVVRFNGEAKVTGKKEKTFLPLTFCQGPNGQCEWRWKGFPKPRPLYGLHELAKRPTSPVLVVEGEKTADAAAKRFESMVVVSPPHGAQAPKSVDWSPLSGRAVTAWGDADAPGDAFADLVVGLASEAGALSSARVHLPDGLPNTWDLADPLPEGLTDENLQALVRDAGDVVDVPKPFKLTKRGVWFEYEDEKSGDMRQLLVCSPLAVAAFTRSSKSDQWGRLLRFQDSDGEWHEWAMPMSLLAGDGAEYRARLLEGGLIPGFDTKWKPRLQQYISHSQPRARALCVDQTGWHISGEKRLFVLPEHTFGEADGEQTIYQTVRREDAIYQSAGTLDDWNDTIGRYCVGNSRLAFAVSMAFAPVLLELVGEESGGINYVGRSSSGKTTVLRVAASAWGSPKYVRQWRATDNALEAVAAAHTDTLLCLDELSQVDARAAGAVAYMLANNQGKGRARRDGSGRPPATWRVLFFSNGEITISDKVREDGRRATAGQAVRVVDVPAEADHGMGIFETLHEFESGDALARHLNEVVKRTYGTAAPAFLEHVVRDAAAISDSVAKHREDFVKSECPDGADSQVSRVAGRFGLISAAGELATALGILAWPQGEAARAAAVCFRAWLEQRGTKGAAEIQQGIDQLRAFLSQHGGSRFEGYNETTTEKIINRAGWRRLDEIGRWEYLVLPTVFRNEICRSLNSTMIARALAEQGFLVPEKGYLEREEKKKAAILATPPNQPRQRLYLCPSAALGDENDEAEGDTETRTPTE